MYFNRLNSVSLSGWNDEVLFDLFCSGASGKESYPPADYRYFLSVLVLQMREAIV